MFNYILMSKERTMSNDPTDLKNPKPVKHSDNEASKMPDRVDDDRKQAPSDKPGKKPGEDEPDVG
jgi:hypothetical protein